MNKTHPTDYSEIPYHNPLTAERIVTIRKFLGLCYAPDQVIHFLPMMKPKVADMLKGNESFPEFIGSKRVKDGPRARPKTVFFNFSIATTLASPDFETKMAVCNAWNEWGYDIYFVANPLAHARRLQASVPVVQALCIESDQNSMEEQEAVMRLLQDRLCGVVFTGNKSLHMYMRFAEPIRNPGFLADEEVILGLRSGACRVSEHRAICNALYSDLKALGFHADRTVLCDYAKPTRVPGFVNCATGRSVELRHADGNARYAFEPGVESGLGGERASEHARVCAVRVCKRRGMGMSMLHHSSNKQIQKTFLDDLHTWRELQRCGIPARHHRVRLHKALFTAKRIMGWSTKHLADEWKAIVSLRPDNIGCSVEEAVEDIEGHWKSIACDEYVCWLPDCQFLPLLDENRRKVLRASLLEAGCPWVSPVANIIEMALLPVIRRVPMACMAGEVAIHSSKIMDACYGRNYKNCLAWLEALNLLVLENPSYIRTVRSRLYFVNVPLVLFSCGFRTHECQWEKHGALTDQARMVA